MTGNPAPADRPDHPHEAGGSVQKRWARGDWMAALALLTSVIGIAVGALGGVAGIRSEFFAPPDCDHHPRLKFVQPSAAIATTTLAAQGNTTYVPTNAIDGDSRTAWIPAGSNGGQGQFITFSFPHQVNLRLVCVINGYAKSEDLHQRNAKIRDVVVKTDRGLAAGTLLDRASYQELPLQPGQTSTMQLTITTYYSGMLSNGRQAYLDAALSEVSCYAK